ncbi:MAG TPA: carboxypeptidase-like regulatory domain-containing protein [Pyrinomonadaceae bacterium]|nr:carboxypeptidase-like regulatory domain-containing protein [Pyrinomonadaceae bacterium]
MKFLQILVLILGLTFVASGQKQVGNAILTGSVFSQIGEIISNAKITVINQKGKRFETLTDEKGNYEIKLPFTVYKRNFDITKLPITKYTIKVEYRGFRIFEIKEFNFIQTKSRKMHLDIALEVGIL